LGEKETSALMEGVIGNANKHGMEKKTTIFCHSHSFGVGFLVRDFTHEEASRV